jgi:hypothetical protein
MSVPKLDIDDQPDDVLREHVHSFTTLAADALAVSFAPQFDALITDWNKVNAVHVQLITALAQAIANAIAIDSKLNQIVDDLVHALTKAVPDKSDPQWYVFFKGDDGSTVKRPILGDQLDRMAVWPSGLADSKHPEVNAIGVALLPLLPVAANAQGAVLLARQKLYEFKKTGAWSKHIESSNAVRASVYGDLLKIPFNNPAAKLPGDYAELFFLHDTSRRGAKKVKSSQEIQDEIDALHVQIEALEADKKIRVEEEAQEAQEAAAKAKAKEDLAALKKQDKENAKKKKELEKKLKKK